jgi:hypothetical protein
VFRNAHENGRGIEVLGSSWQQFHDFSKNLRFTASAKDAYGMANEVIQTVRFDSFLSSPMALVTEDQSRLFLLKGAARNSDFIVDYEKARLGTFIPPRPFDFAAEIRLRADAKPIPEVKRGFAMGALVRANSGELSHRTLLRSLHGLMQVLEPHNIVRLPQEAGGEKLSVLARKSRGEIIATLPDTIKYVERYQEINFEPIIEKQASTGKEFTRVVARSALNIPAIQRDYPEFGDYLETLLTSFEFKVTGHYDLPNGLRLVNFQLDSEHQAIRIEFMTAGGAIVPVDEKGQPHEESMLRFEGLEKHAGTIVVNAGGEALGLRFNLEDLRFSNDYVDGPIMHSGGKIVKLPPPKITGRALGIFPTWAIDLSIPGSLDEYATMITKGFVRGVDGKGTYLHQTIDTRNPKANLVEMEMGTMMVDNFFVNFGMRIVQKFIWPSESVLSEMRQVAQDFGGHIAKDLVRLSPVAPEIAH